MDLGPGSFFHQGSFEECPARYAERLSVLIEARDERGVLDCLRSMLSASLESGEPDWHARTWAAKTLLDIKYGRRPDPLGEDMQ